MDKLRTMLCVACTTVAILLVLTNPTALAAYETMPYEFDGHGRMGPHVLLTKATVQILLKLISEKPEVVFQETNKVPPRALSRVKNALSQCPDDVQDFIGCQNSAVWGAIQEDGNLRAITIVEATKRRLEQSPADLRDGVGQPLQGKALEEAKALYEKVKQKSLRELETQLGAREVKGLLRFCNHFFNPYRSTYYPPLCEPPNIFSRLWAKVRGVPTSLSRLLAMRELPQWLERFDIALLPPRANAVTWATHSENEFAWQRAAIRYQLDSLDGMKILGHVLHLVQDLTVPLHVRGDIHPIHKDYEGFATLFSTRAWFERVLNDRELLAIFRNRVRAGPRRFTLSVLLGDLARYTHDGFVTDDTMPMATELAKLFLRNGQFVVRPIAPEEKEYWAWVSKRGNNIDKRYIKIAEQTEQGYRITERVAKEYWEILALKAIEQGLIVAAEFCRQMVATDDKSTL